MHLFAACISIIGILVFASLIIGLIRARSSSERASSVIAFVVQMIFIVLFLVFVVLLKQKGIILIALACLCAVLPILAYAITFTISQKKERKKILQDRQNQALYMQQMLSIQQANAQRNKIQASGAAQEISLNYSDEQIVEIVKKLLAAQGIDYASLAPQQQLALKQHYSQQIINAAKASQAQQAKQAHQSRMQQRLQLQQVQQQQVHQAKQIQQVRQAQQLQQIKTQVQAQVQPKPQAQVQPQANPDSQAQSAKEKSENIKIEAKPQGAQAVQAQESKKSELLKDKQEQKEQPKQTEKPKGNLEQEEQFKQTEQPQEEKAQTPKPQVQQSAQIQSEENDKSQETKD